MNIVCAIDETYAQHCGVMLCSLFADNPGARFQVFIISDGLTEPSRDKLTRVALGFRQQLVFLEVPARMFQSVSVSGHVSIAGYFRFLIPQILPDDVDKALFLDSDIIVKGSVAELYDQSIERYTHAAVVNPLCGPVHKAIPASLGMPHGSSYFNSGVLVLNLRMWREEQISERVVEYFHANAGRLHFWHHDALNATLHGRCRTCHPIWDAQEAFFLDRSADQSP